jgi:phage-related protein
MLREKPLEWAGSSKRDLLKFPEDARRAVGYALGLAQLGGKHPTAKPWHGEGPGVLEFVESADGVRTARPDIELVHQRLMAATRHYKEHHGNEN